MTLQHHLYLFRYTSRYPHFRLSISNLLLTPIPTHPLNQYHLLAMANTTEYYESKICGKIEKLNQLNYLRWVTRMCHHLTATQCLSIVLGEEPCPDNARTTAYRSWIEKDGRAMGTLLGACSQEIAIHIEGSTSSADMWKVLAGIANSADTETGRDLLFREFIDIKAIPGEPLSNFFGKLQETVGLLAGTDHQISSYHHRTQLLRNLPSEYDIIRTVIEDKTPQPTIQSIIETLKRTERELDTTKKRVASTNTSATTEAALYAGQTQALRGRGGYYRGGRGRSSNHRSTPYTDNRNCYNCGKPGHRAAECSQMRIALSCFNCGDTTHGMANCPHETLTLEQARKGRSAYSVYLNRKRDTNTAKANLAEEPETTGEPSL